ncbi:hypothetical protein HAZT_HAZT004520 [Hyalella azteca]|uniref:Aromatic amino acid beta-eliminating lyase/threonine aldolase domain-containing protein n=1 Tax=Hyalella azteca TaxID=294128 RepID=A0A6A0H5J0_HYAAZ|nr:hypothetical protein HAZT_HAZT004520 [Hyalella azteca]
MPVFQGPLEGAPHHTVDLRSDTVTYPSIKMKEAMFRAPVGDDVFGEDPTVKELEKKIASLLGKESALLVPSGTMANLICVLTHCWMRGSEVILGDQSHLHVWAQGGIAQIGNIHHRTLKNLPDGSFSLTELKALVRGDDPHWPVTSLVCIENTQNMLGGKALPLRWLDEIGAVCQELGLPLHCDGARLLNAAVAVGQPPSRLVRHCQSVAFCINKGLGAPMGSLVVGSKEFIERAIRVRKVLGGGLHQAGMFAAAGLYALEHVAPRLAWDHTHARAIAQGEFDREIMRYPIAGVKEMHSSAVTVDLKEVQTNMVLLTTDNIRVNAKKLCDRLAMVSDEEAEELDEQTVVMMLPITDTVVRCMTHCALTKSDIASVVKKLKFVINEYDSMVFLEYKIEVGQG